MNKLFFNLLLCGIFFFCQVWGVSSPLTSQTPAIESQEEEGGIVFFTPPAGWHLAEPSMLPKHVRVMVIGKGLANFPPSMNLSSEPYKGTLKQYLKSIKNMNTAQGYEWKDLGTIRTEAGNASLSQVDTKTQFGDVRLMHVILFKHEQIYILTASALKQDFSSFYQVFFNSMRSLRVVKDLYEMIANPQQRTQLKSAADKIQDQWQSLLAQKQQESPETSWKDIQDRVFKSEQFQNSIWKPLQEMLTQKYNSLGPEWQSLFLKKLEERLLHSQPKMKTNYIN